MDKYAKVQVGLFTYAKLAYYWLWLVVVETVSLLEQDALGHTDLTIYCVPFCLYHLLYFPTFHRIQQLSHRLLLVALRWSARPWFPVLLLQVFGTQLVASSPSWSATWNRQKDSEPQPSHLCHIGSFRWSTDRGFQLNSFGNTLEYNRP